MRSFILLSSVIAENMEVFQAVPSIGPQGKGARAWLVN